MHDHSAAGAKAASEKPLPEPLQVDGAGVVAQSPLNQLQSALADVGGADIGQLAFQGEGSAGVDIGDARDVRAVVVSAGQHVQQVANRTGSHGLQPLHGFGVHALYGYSRHGVIRVARAGSRLGSDVWAPADCDVLEGVAWGEQRDIECGGRNCRRLVYGCFLDWRAINARMRVVRHAGQHTAPGRNPRASLLKREFAVRSGYQPTHASGIIA